MSRQPRQRRLTHAIALALGAVLLSGAAGVDGLRLAGPAASDLRNEQTAVAAQQESTAAFRELQPAPATERVRPQPGPSRLHSRAADVDLGVAALKLEAPAAGSGPFGQRPLSSACPPQGPPA